MYNCALTDFLIWNYSSGISLVETVYIFLGNSEGSKISNKIFTINLNETLIKIQKTLDNNQEIFPAYKHDIVLNIKPRSNLNRIIKIVLN
jgi:hypothetical protein